VLTLYTKITTALADRANLYWSIAYRTGLSGLVIDI